MNYFSILQQDSHFGGAGNENERKPESTSLPNKHSPSSKKSVARAEVSFLNYNVNLDINQTLC